MVAATLLGLASTYKISHRFKYFVHSSQMFVNKMLIVHFKKPVVSFILLRQPMPRILTRYFYLFFYLGF